MIFQKNHQNKIKAALILTLAAIFICLAQTAGAQEIMQGAAMSGIQGLFDIISNTLFFVVGGVAALFLTTHILQWVIVNQADLTSFDNGFVSRGLGMTQGLADMLMLLAFVVASFGIIFKQKEFEAKRTVINLGFIAIMTRFGPLAVKMMVDIGNLAINTIVGNNTNLITSVNELLLVDMVKMLGTMAVAMVWKTIAFSLPWVNSISLGAFLASMGIAGSMIVGGIALISGGPLIYFAFNFVTKWVFQLFASYMLAGVFFTYIILFVSRVFMLQILAVTSPLAIASLALPQTKHWFSKWWQELTSWTFVGVYTMFFLMLGLGSADFILPPASKALDSNMITGFFEGFAIDSYILYYLFLIVYLSLVQSMAQKDGTMAAMFRSTMLGGAMAAYTHMIRPAANKTRDYAIDKSAEASSRIEALKKAGGRAGIGDTAALHGFGLLANATKENTFSGVRTLFSGDQSRIENATKSKDWSLGKLSNTEDLINARINDIAKDLTFEEVIKDGEKIGAMKAAAAFKKFGGQKDQETNMATLMETLEKAGKFDLVMAAMNKNNIMTPARAQSLQLLRDNVANSESLAEAINKQDSNGRYLDKSRTLLGISDEDKNKEDNFREANEMRARILSLKDTAMQNKGFEKLPSLDIFQNKKNRLAYLASAKSNALAEVDSKYEEYAKMFYDDIKQMSEQQFKNMCQVNKDLIKAMAAKPNLAKHLPTFTHDASGAVDLAKIEEYAKPQEKKKA